MIKFFRTLFCMPDEELMYLKLMAQRLTEIEKVFKSDYVTHDLPNAQRSPDAR